MKRQGLHIRSWGYMYNKGHGVETQKDAVWQDTGRGQSDTGRGLSKDRRRILQDTSNGYKDIIIVSGSDRG
jgi:hypothetical protein